MTKIIPARMHEEQVNMKTPDYDCSRCKLHHQRKRVVYGCGKQPHPKFIIVGEAPGKEEDDKGEPFVGGAGRILSAILSEARILRTDCYITNVCKCRPPNNRTPEIDETLACQDFLFEEIKTLKPQAVIALGQTATFTLTGKNVTEYRGSILPCYHSKIPTLITYHPAFLMRQRDMYSVVVNDCEKLHNIHDFTKEAQEFYQYNIGRIAFETLCKTWMKMKDWIAVDIETKSGGEDESDGLNPFSEDYKIIGISFTPMAGQGVHLNGMHLDMCWDLIKTLLEKHPYIVYQNNRFDRLGLWLKHEISSNVCWDTLTGMYIINSSLPKKLDFLRSVYTNIPPYKGIYKTKGKYQPGLLKDSDLGRLNCLDTDVTWRVAKEQQKYLDKKLMDRMLMVDNMLCDMTVKGVKPNTTRIAVHYAKQQPIIEQCEQEFTETFGCSISSSQQLGKLIYEDLGFNPMVKHLTPKGKPSTDEDAIDALAAQCGLIHISDEDGDRFEGESKHKKMFELILNHRRTSKEVSTYLTGIYKIIQPDKRIHPNWNSTGTDTTRLACRNPNMQNVPKHLRDIFEPEAGKIYLAGDYKGLEVITAAVLSEDYKLLEILEREGSIHPFVLRAIEEKYPLSKMIGPVMAKVRVKAVVFGTFYGRSERSIAEEFKVPTKTVEEWRKIFYGEFPKLKYYFEEYLPKFFAEKGYVECWPGFRKYAENVRQAKNMPVQGTAAQICYNGMQSLCDNGFNIVINVHDQIVCEEPDEGKEINKIKLALFKKCMEESTPELYHKFLVEEAMGYNWKEVS